MDESSASSLGNENCSRKRKSKQDKRNEKREKKDTTRKEVTEVESRSNKLELPGKYHLVLKDLRNDAEDCAVKISRTGIYTSNHLSVAQSRLSVTGNKGYRLARATHAAPRSGSWYYEITVELNFGHVRVGWGLGQSDMDLPCGSENCSYSYRDIEGTKFNCARPTEYGESYTTGDVIGCYIALPPRRAGVDDATARTPCVRAASQAQRGYFRSLTDRAVLQSGISGDPSELQVVYVGNFEYYVLPEIPTDKMQKHAGSSIQFSKNGVPQGVAFKDVWQGHYSPAVSLFKNAKVTFNFGPDFKFPPSDSMTGYRPMSDLTELLRPPSDHVVDAADNACDAPEAGQTDAAAEGGEDGGRGGILRPKETETASPPIGSHADMLDAIAGSARSETLVAESTRTPLSTATPSPTPDSTTTSAPGTPNEALPVDETTERTDAAKPMDMGAESAAGISNTSVAPSNDYMVEKPNPGLAQPTLPTQGESHNAESWMHSPNQQ